MVIAVAATIRTYIAVGSGIATVFAWMEPEANLPKLFLTLARSCMSTVPLPSVSPISPLSEVSGLPKLAMTLSRSVWSTNPSKFVSPLRRTGSEIQNTEGSPVAPLIFGSKMMSLSQNRFMPMTPSCPPGRSMMSTGILLNSSLSEPGAVWPLILR